VGDKRRSGFLIPNAKYSTKNGVEFSLPYYWNIAPNFDATITPHYMNKRGGVMWENEFRYLTQLGSGLTSSTTCRRIKSTKTITPATATAAAGCSTGTTRGYRSGVASERRLHQSQRS
jgi:lipopolysaccharide assembly outer membrane protein LptD (OstA)